MKAVIAYQKKVNDVGHNPKDALKMDQEMEKRRKIIVRSFSIAKNLYDARIDMPLSKEPDLEAGAEFLDVKIISLSRGSNQLFRCHLLSQKDLTQGTKSQYIFKNLPMFQLICIHDSFSCPSSIVVVLRCVFQRYTKPEKKRIFQ